MKWQDVENYTKYNVDTVSITYSGYGDFYTCKIQRLYHKKLPIEFLSNSAENAFEGAKTLLLEVEALEKEIGDYLKPEKDDPTVLRHHRRLYGEKRVRFKRYADGYVILDISEVDTNGYAIVRDPYKPESCYYPAKDYKKNRLKGIEQEQSYLKSGEELYIYDNIGYLCGSAGFAVVKDGLVIKTKGALMA